MRLSQNTYSLPLSITLAIVMSLIWQLSYAGPILDRIIEHRLDRQTESTEYGESSSNIALPAGIRVVRDFPYGKDSQQRMDIYLPAQVSGAPVIFMVHGGAWRLGDKGAKGVVENKVNRWVNKGFIFISANYRLLPKTAPLQQAQDIASALATAQNKATSWGGDSTKFILMGHSAGAHLVALLTASPELALNAGAKPWLGSVLLDSAALNVVKIMEAKHARFYDRAFGSDATYWRAVSPYDVITESAPPFLAVCSLLRDESCQQADQFTFKARSLKVRASILKENMSHMEINKQLGIESDYTNTVESFMRTLDESVMGVLTHHRYKSETP
jgi:arylformamidase